MQNERRNELLDKVQAYCNLLRHDTLDMTLEERVFLLERLRITIQVVESIFREGMNNDKSFDVSN